MNKAQNIFYSTAALMIFIVGPALIETRPLWAIGSIAVAGICVRIAEKEVKKSGRR